jgi:hypothetical protein
MEGGNMVVLGEEERGKGRKEGGEILDELLLILLRCTTLPQ